MLLVEYSIPAYLTEKKNIVRHILFTALFALVFINIYAPFGVENWVKLTKIQLIFSSSLVILTGVLVVFISRIIMYQVCRKKKLNYFRYGLWITGEIVSMAMVYAILQAMILKDKRDFTLIFKSTLTTTLLVLLIPYTLTWLYFSWMDKNRKLEKMTGTSLAKTSIPLMLVFNDEKGELRFSLKTQDLLYLEAADNYVIIHYADHGKLARYIIRNSLKNMEAGLMDSGVIRCHRSYMVNFERVKIIKKERDGLVIELDEVEKHSIPVSKTYVEQVMKIFSAYSLGE
jgi:DNA-binding LytR/AlgR family response regulator